MEEAFWQSCLPLKSVSVRQRQFPAGELTKIGLTDNLCVFDENKLFKQLSHLAAQKGLLLKASTLSGFDHTSSTLAYMEGVFPKTIQAAQVICTDYQLMNCFFTPEEEITFNESPRYAMADLEIDQHTVEGYALYPLKNGFVATVLLPNNNVRIITNHMAPDDVQDINYWRQLLASATECKEEVLSVKNAQLLNEVFSTTPPPMRHGNVFFLNTTEGAFAPHAPLAMNEAVEDIINLGWKLQHYQQKHCHKQLLKSYKEERQPSHEAHITLNNEVITLLSESGPFRQIRNFLFFKLAKYKKKLKATFLPSNKIHSSYFISSDIKAKKLPLGEKLAPKVVQRLFPQAVPGYTVFTTQKLNFTPEGWQVKPLAELEEAGIKTDAELVVIRPDRVVAATYKKATQQNLNQYLKVGAFNFIPEPEDA